MKIVLVVGASGTGKDSLLRSARSYYKHDSRFCFARRFVTRPPDENEDNYYIDRAGFLILKNHGYFLAEWEAYGNLYGIPWSACEAAQGSTLFCSVSRTAIRGVEKQFDSVTTLQITARAEMLQERLEKRARENAASIEKRIARAKELCHARDLILFDNSPPLSLTTVSFIDMLPKLVMEKADYSFNKMGFTENLPSLRTACLVE
ncbi:MAG: phosphonate metabolism protein/1,5-bisphosphokinase (PRPP-forming) PhnN [Proteobacteria bacterium]|nr:phosphonate metabolism protein/1,5-bisphosphokinase (PRPP-forming) PhnN [Pseudomonadota bacterium]MBU1140581.1 phosphonate metabolism protein/1,5-bisphosphokinase (PRPP-forming) PhnN [Pseudomonadota bacterium]MBU1234027.1 phosphonate metabolism protein/1,5-bisphosphokinase (PRPP-forming) PhnN [Pseudomonadota bacterium]MBU1418754.1 phosphonate metabolism protein/1,5-bisphosphokinase (PRPP-forming) PhnN [Pseudomonadota bacterium]MBU1455482.1 phosphonate metabolism protein/1,5-bisphosphokinase 